jgi:hypothetical protein
MGRLMPTANELDLLRRHSGAMLLRHRAKSNQDDDDDVAASANSTPRHLLIHNGDPGPGM